MLSRNNPDRALSYLKKIPFHRLPLSLQAEAYEKKALACQMGGLFRRSIFSYQIAYRCYRQINDLWGAVHAAQHCGDGMRQMEQFQLALSWYSRAKALCRRLKGSASTIAAFRADLELDSAMAVRGLGNYSLAITTFQNVIQTYRRASDQEGEAYATWALGTTQRFMGRLNEAEKNLRKSLSLYRTLKDESGLAYAMAGLGGALRMKGLPRVSGALYQKANQLFLKMGDQFGLAYTSCGQGNALRMQNKLGAALSFMDQAIRRYEKLGQKGPLGYVLWSRSQIFIFRRQFSQALADLNRAHRLFRLVKDRRGLLYVDLGRGLILKYHHDERGKNFFKKLVLRAHKEHLPWEGLHAQSHFLSPTSVRNGYEKMGVNTHGFSQYKTLP